MQSWGLFEWTLAVLTGAAGVMMWASQVGPKQAISHTAEWVTAIGFRNPPRWLVSTETDRAVRHIAALILLISVTLILIQAVDLEAMHPIAKAIFGLAAVGIGLGIALNLTQPNWADALRHPSFFLIFGLVVALAAAIWQMVRTPAERDVASLRTQVQQQAIEIERLKGVSTTSVHSIAPVTSNATSPGETAVVAAPPSTETPREFTNRSPKQLLALYEGRTPFQADKLVEPYKGLWIEAESKVLNVIPDGQYGSVVVLRDDKDTIECRFGSSWSNTVGRLDIGDPVRVRGKISTSQNGQQLYLLECEVVQRTRGSIEPTQITPKDGGVFDWDFRGLLGQSLSDKGHYVAKIWIEGKNSSSGAIPITSAKIVSLVTGKTTEMQIRTDRGYVPPEQANPIPPNARFYLHALFYDPLKHNVPEGLSADEFLSTWGSFGFEIGYMLDLQASFWRHRFESKEIKAMLDAFNKRPEPEPKVTRRDL